MSTTILAVPIELSKSLREHEKDTWIQQNLQNYFV